MGSLAIPQQNRKQRIGHSGSRVWEGPRKTPKRVRRKPHQKVAPEIRLLVDLAICVLAGGNLKVFAHI
jgi:hypothetical protein